MFGLFNKKSIESLFKIDLKTLPDDQCKLLDKEDDKSIYARKFSENELYLFDYCQILVFGNGSKNIIFYTSKKNPPTANQLGKVVEKVVGICGKDDQGNKKWNDDDTEALMDGYWSGRAWFENKPVVMMSGGKQQDGKYQFTLSICGV